MAVGAPCLAARGRRVGPRRPASMTAACASGTSSTAHPRSWPRRWWRASGRRRRGGRRGCRPGCPADNLTTLATARSTAPPPRPRHSHPACTLRWTPRRLGRAAPTVHRARASEPLAARQLRVAAVPLSTFDQPDRPDRPRPGPWPPGARRSATSGASVGYVGWSRRWCRPTTDAPDPFLDRRDGARSGHGRVNAVDRRAHPASSTSRSEGRSVTPEASFADRDSRTAGAVQGAMPDAACHSAARGMWNLHA